LRDGRGQKSRQNGRLFNDNAGRWGIGVDRRVVFFSANAPGVKDEEAQNFSLPAQENETFFERGRGSKEHDGDSRCDHAASLLAMTADGLG
jgi:hypothetical protein